MNSSRRTSHLRWLPAWVVLLLIPIVGTAAMTAPAAIAATSVAKPPLIRSLSQAQTTWPNATYAPSGWATTPGEYIIPFDGGYALLTFSTGVMESPSTPSGPRGVNLPALIGSAPQVLCCGGGGGTCGDYVTEWSQATVNPGVPGGEVGFSSASARIDLCTEAWGQTESPVCSGDFVSCQLWYQGWGPNTGYNVTAQDTLEAQSYPAVGGGNAWTVYCRVYFSASGANPYGQCTGA